MKTILIILLILFSCVFARTHQDLVSWYSYGNVKIYFTTGYGYEEINKARIIGTYAKLLCEKLDYSESVCLEFQHDYIKDMYLPSFEILTNFISWRSEEFNICVYQRDYSFDITKTLKLLEYAILNEADIRRDSSHSDSTIIKGIIESKSQSKTITDILSHRIRRPEKDDIDTTKGFFYFVQDGLINIYLKRYSLAEDSIMSINNIFQFERLGYDGLMIFDTDSTFYFVVDFQNPTISKRHVIENSEANWKPYFVNLIGRDYITINLDYYVFMRTRKDTRYLLYDIYNDFLIQDLENELKDVLPPKRKEDDIHRY